MMYQYVLEHVFHKCEGQDGPFYWRETVDQDGYIVYWPPAHPDDEWWYLHTYRYPPDVWG